MPDQEQEDRLAEHPRPTQALPWPEGEEGNLRESFDLLTRHIDLSPPLGRSIFVNRTLRLDRIDWIGFDMDYTLVRYNEATMAPLLYDKAREKLLQAGYPEAIMEWEYDPQRVMRGIWIDKQSGNLLQLNRHRLIKRGFHGHEKLSKEQRRRYRLTPFQLGETEEGVTPFRLIDTLFGVPEACLYADIIAWRQREGASEGLDFYALYEEVRTAMDGAHADESVHRAIMADMARYILPDPELATTLQRFRVWGKKLFVLTNSDWGYTQAAMSFLLDGQKQELPRWTDYFDLVSVKACKPSYFSSDTPFELLDPEGNSLGLHDEYSGTPFARGGNQRAMNRALGVMGERVLYVGDHIYGDILRTKKSSTWRTLLILEELEREIELRQEHKQQLETWRQLHHKRQLLDTELHHQSMLLEKLQLAPPAAKDGSTTLEEKLYNSALAQTQRQLERLQRELDQVILKADALYEDLQTHFNPYWGMMFREGNAPSYLSEQVRKFACLYSSRVSNFRFYLPTQYFRPPHLLLPHEIELGS